MKKDGLGAWWRFGMDGMLGGMNGVWMVDPANGLVSFLDTPLLRVIAGYC